MYFERVIKLLFAITVVSIFSYLLIYFAVGLRGNGGEYWGFNGLENPHQAATRAYEAADYRLLRVSLSTAQGTKVDEVPLSAFCNGIAFGSDLPSRPSVDKLIHGPDSVRLASEFAFRYNNTVAVSIGEKIDPPCEAGWYGFRPIDYGPMDRDWIGYVVLAFLIALFGAIYFLSPGQRQIKSQLKYVQSKLRAREASREESEQIQERLEEERRLRTLPRRIRRFFPRRK